ncbi:4Fe-4S binding protein [Halomonas sp. DP8Y7-3]|uniref:4Fe-4S binding protein n=1 Tax=Halomonas sp. DP8Y7-3 TaxID=2859079 RepID=UPI001C942405|nr:4Fe-4S binding protein [Halomonas sp. DP8Y7-3]MBY5930629.1 4Fe-4S binding protein [Halomonas sp. DP8Y7-3]
MRRCLSASVKRGDDERSRLDQLGHWLADHRRAVLGLQWSVVLFYAVLLLIPPLLPLPDYQSRILGHLTVFAEFVFWGIWWPFVMVSMVVAGRLWCGLLCPEGAISEAASRVGLGRAIPRWMHWGGWPLVGFVMTTVYGQLISVYQYPKAALLVLGGSTVAAALVGVVYGKGKRVWCRHLCPVSGVFALLAKLSPLHVRTEPASWHRYGQRRRRGEVARQPAPDCPVLLPLKQLDSASDCHLCSRCTGYKSAIHLELRAPGAEVIAPPPQRPATVWEYLLVVFGLLGVAVGAFHWSASPWFVAAKQSSAVWLYGHGAGWLLDATAPWWLLTHYPEQHDVFSLLDGALLLGYIGVTALTLGGWTSALLGLANLLLGRWSWRRLWHLSYALIPLAGGGVFLGLSMTTLTLLRGEGWQLLWADDVRALLLMLVVVVSACLSWGLLGRYVSGMRRGLAMGLMVLAQAPVVGAWWLLFWGW